MQLSGKIEDGRQFESKSVIFQVDVPHLSWGMISSFQLHCCACSRRLLHVHGGVLQSDRSVELYEWTSCWGCKCGSTSALSGSGCSSIVSLFFLELKTCYNMTRLSFLIASSLLHDVTRFLDVQGENCWRVSNAKFWTSWNKNKIPKSSAPQMNIGSNILVLTDGRASDATFEDLHYPPRNNETYLIAQTLQWRNRVSSFFLSFKLISFLDNLPVDSDEWCSHQHEWRRDVYRRVSRAVQGDLLMLDKKELNSVS